MKPNGKINISMIVFIGALSTAIKKNGGILNLEKTTKITKFRINGPGKDELFIGFI